MPTDEHVDVLGRGAAVWNAWRAQHDEVPDLSRAGLRGLDLTGFDLSRADLRGADLRGTNLCDADLSGARLEGANFFKATLDGADPCQRACLACLNTPTSRFAMSNSRAGLHIHEKSLDIENGGFPCPFAFPA